MARFRRLETLQTIAGDGLVPIFYQADAPTAIEIARAIHAGGSRVIEFTNRGDGAPNVFSDMVRACRDELPDAIVGVGTISDAATAALYLSLGADFIVTPVLSADVIRTCNRRKVPVLPGCGSASEIAAAEELGCEVIKVFPADALGGPTFINSVLGPSPWSSLMPTGGVAYSAESVQSWIRAGAVAVGIGSALVSKDVVASGSFETITERTSKLLGWIRAAKTESTAN